MKKTLFLLQLSLREKKLEKIGFFATSDNFIFINRCLISSFITRVRIIQLYAYHVMLRYCISLEFANCTFLTVPYLSRNALCGPSDHHKVLLC